MNEFNTDRGADAKSIVDTAAQTAEQAIRSSQRAANQAVDRYSESIDAVRARTGAALDGIAASAGQLTHRGMEVVREGSHRLRTSSRQAADSTLGYIRDEPVKSMLLAAAAGATLLALLSLIGRRAVR
jgi:ElaB/YqjD/DUF883 family membrane-anchored ribosome-binding protein